MSFKDCRATKKKSLKSAQNWANDGCLLALVSFVLHNYGVNNRILGRTFHIHLLQSNN
jgi:hypothetical protein